MKKFCSQLLVVIAGFAFFTSAFAATVWVPTGDTIIIKRLPGTKGKIGLFDNADMDFSGKFLKLKKKDKVKFFEKDGIFKARHKKKKTLNLMDSSEFILGIRGKKKTGWLPVTEYIDLGNGTFELIFGTQGSLQVTGVQAVPIPAAIWLLGSGLFGFFTIAGRRKTT